MFLVPKPTVKGSEMNIAQPEDHHSAHKSQPQFHEYRITARDARAFIGAQEVIHSLDRPK
jgi:hypothetical protein